MSHVPLDQRADAAWLELELELGEKPIGPLAQVGEKDVESVVLALRAGTGSIRVTVRGLDSGHAQVRAIEGPTAERKSWRSLRFDNAGFTLEGLAPGRYRVSIYSQPGMGEGKTEVQVGAGEATTTVDFEKRD